jgi:hypothetical protein
VNPQAMADQWFKDVKDVGGQVQEYGDRLIDRDPKQWWVAGAIKTTYDWYTTLTAPVVDLLRLGEGSAKGGWGYGEDALRLVSIIGPEGRCLAVTLKSRFAKLGEMVANSRLGNCAWIAGAKALRITGVKALATVDDLARIAGIPTSCTGETSVSTIALYLRQLGATVHELKVFPEAQGELNTALAFNKQQEVLALAKANPGGVVMFGVGWKYNGRDVGHALLAYYDAVKGLVIADRTGRVVRSLKELDGSYKGISGAVPVGSVVFIKDALIVDVLRKLNLLSTLVLPIRVLQLREESAPQNGPVSRGAAVFSPKLTPARQ